MAYPSWLEAEGAATFSYLFRGTPAKMPVPWDATFLTRWTNFVTALGNRYNGNPALELVHITTSSGNGFEMQLPSTPTDVANWNTAGYTVTKHVDAYKQVIDAFDAAFPDTPLDLEVHPVLNSDSVAQQAVAYGNEIIGDRFGVFAAWWSQKNADTVYPGMYSLLRAQAAQTFATVQLVTNAKNDPNGFGDGGIQTALNRAYADGIRYFEPWDTDILNSSSAPMFQQLHDATAHEVAVKSGDYNQDGAVTALDYAQWRSQFGSAVDSFTASDGNGNGLIDAGDYLIWRNRFTSATIASASAVPESTIFCHVLSLALALLRFRGRCIPSQRESAQLC
jgi:hypothetical protein